MKKLILICFILANAQNIFSQFSGFGISGGGNSAKFLEQPMISGANQDHYDQKNKLGVNAGIKLEWKLFGSESIKLSPEIYFMQKGSSEYLSKAQLINYVTERKIDLSYVGLCLPLKIELNGEYQTDAYIQINGYADYNVNAETSDDDTIIFDNPFAKVDAGISANLAFAVGQGVYLQAGYHKGLKSIEFLTQDSNTQTPNINYLVQNQNFSLAIVYLFQN
jgi:hypothetical protein